MTLRMWVCVCLHACGYISLEYWVHLRYWKEKESLLHWVGLCLFMNTCKQDSVYLCVWSQVAFDVDLFKLAHTVAGGKNLWTLNDSAPFHSILISQRYLWGKREGGGARRSMKTSSFPIYPCCLATAGPSFVKSAVADGKVGGRKWTYRMHTGMTAIPIQRKQGLKDNVCDLRIWMKMNRAVVGLCGAGGCIFVTCVWLSYHFFLLV